MTKKPTIQMLLDNFPHPYDKDILDVGSQTIEAFSAECPLARLRTYYIDQNAAGNSTGGSGDGTIGTPWLCNSLSDLATLIAAQQTGGNKAFLLKRGSVFKGNSAGPVLSADNVTISDYGTGAKVELWRSTRVTSGWTLVGGTKYQRTDATAVSWALLPTSNAYISAPLSRQASAAAVPTVITGCGGSFSYVGTTLTIDIGVNPNGVNIDIVYENADNGILVTGNGCRVNSIRTVGFGNNVTTPANQASGFKYTAAGNSTCLVSNFDSFYGSSHLIAQYGSGAGSRLGVANALVGWATPSTGPTLINFYAPGGGHVGVCVGAYGYGELPSGLTPTSDAALVYGHSDGQASSLYYCQYAKPFDSTITPFGAHLNAWGHAVSANYNPASYRAFFVDSDRGGQYVTSAAPDTCWINCTGRHVVTGSASPTVIQTGSDDRGLYINDDQIIHATAATMSGSSYAVNNKTLASGAVHDARRINSRVRLTGVLTSQIFRWDHRNLFGELGSRVWENCLFVNETGGGNLQFASGNSATRLVGNAYYNIAAGTDATAGYDLDAYDVTLTDLPPADAVPAIGDALTAGTNRNDLAYDKFGRLRDESNSTIGPVAHASIGGAWDGVVVRRRN